MDYHTESHFTKTSTIPNANVDTIPNTIQMQRRFSQSSNHCSILQITIPKSTPKTTAQPTATTARKGVTYRHHRPFQHLHLPLQRTPRSSSVESNFWTPPPSPDFCPLPSSSAPSLFEVDCRTGALNELIPDPRREVGVNSSLKFGCGIW